MRIYRFVVLASIDFDDQCRIPAEKVDDVGIDGDLPPKLPTFQLAGSEL